MSSAHESTRVPSLSARAARGDEQAFTELVRETSPLVFRLAVRGLGSAEEARDVVQETYLRAWQRLHTVRDHDTIVGWLCRICRNLVTDRLRARTRKSVNLDRLAQVLGPVLEQMAAEQPRADELLADARARAALWQLIGDLKEKHRAVLLLRVADGLDNQQIAQALGCPIGTVESRLHRARLALARKLKKTRAYALDRHTSTRHPRRAHEL